MKLGKPIKYIAVSPEEVIERVKKKVKEEADKQTSIIDNLKESEILDELKTLHSQGVEMVEPTELSGAIKGRGNLYNHIEGMIKAADKSVDIMTTADGLVRKAETLKSLMQRTKERGIKIRIAAPLSEKTEKAVEELKDIADVRDVSNVKARFCLIDGKQLTFMLMDDSEVHPTYDAAIWVNTSFFASALKQMFETEWAATQLVEKTGKN